MTGDTPPNSAPKPVPDVDQLPVEEQPPQESSPEQPKMASARRRLSRRVVVGGGAFLAAVGAGVGTAVGGDLYQWVFGKGSGGSREPSGGGSSTGTPGDPLSIAVTAIGVDPKCIGFQFLVDRTPDQVAKEIKQLEAYPKQFSTDIATVRKWLRSVVLSRDEAAVRDWLFAVRGVQVPTWVQVTVQGRGSNVVVLNRLRIVVHQRRPAYGTVVRSIMCQSSGLVPRYFDVDLGEPARAIVRPGSDDAPGPLVEGAGGSVIDFPYKVSGTDPEIFNLIVTKVPGDCLWTAVLDWVADGKPTSTIISDHGRPFHATSAPDFSYGCTTDADGTTSSC